MGKRWHHLLAVLLVFCVAAGLVWRFWPSSVSPYDMYLDKDLTQLSNAGQYDLAVLLDKQLQTDEHVGSLEHPPSDPEWMFWRKSPTRYLGGPQPWFFWRMKTSDGPTRLVLLEQHRLRQIPDHAYATIHVFDLQGKHLNETTFVMGYRMYFEHARKLYDADLDADLVEIGTGALFMDSGITRRWIGIVEDRPVFLRGESGKGNWFSPPYAGYKDNKDPLSTRTIEEWQAALQSDRAMLALEAALWFSDDTSLSTPGLEEHYPKTYARVKQIAQAKRQPAIQRALHDLTDSPHPWIKEAAAHALKPNP
jgi:hypothetical protein